MRLLRRAGLPRAPSRPRHARHRGRVAFGLAVSLLLLWAWHGWSSPGAQADLETLWSLCAGGVGDARGR